MDMVFIDTVLCELATDYGTSSKYTEGLEANPGPDTNLSSLFRTRKIVNLL